MKHKLKITILSILFGLLFGIPVYAAGNTYIIDQSDVLGEYISTLNEKAEKISEEAGLRITCMITNTTEGMGTPAVSEQVYKGLFADDPGFMLIYSIDDQEWFIYSSGMESAPLTEEQENELWNEFAIQDYYVDCVDAYLDAAAAICSVDSQGVAEPAATDSQGDDQTAGADTRFHRCQFRFNISQSSGQTFVLGIIRRHRNHLLFIKGYPVGGAVRP